MTEGMMIVFLLSSALLMDDATRLDDREEQIKALVEDFERRLCEKPGECPITTPLRVIKRGDKYLVIAGNNRLLAARRVPGIDRLPCIVLPDGMNPAELFTEMFRDNELHRGYSPLEKAHGVCRLAELANISHADAAKRLLGSASEASKMGTFLKGFPKDLWPLIGDGEGKVPFSTVTYLARLSDEAMIRSLTDLAVRGLLTRDGAAEKVQELLGGKKSKPKPTKFRQGKTTVETLSEDPEQVFGEMTAVINAIRAAQKAGVQNPVRIAPQFLKNPPQN